MKGDTKSTAATETSRLSNMRVTGFKVEGGGFGGIIDTYFTFSGENGEYRSEASVVLLSELPRIIDFYKSVCPDDQRYDVAIAISDICKRLEIDCPINVTDAEAHRVGRTGRSTLLWLFVLFVLFVLCFFCFFCFWAFSV